MAHLKQGRDNHGAYVKGVGVLYKGIRLLVEPAASFDGGADILPYIGALSPRDAHALGFRQNCTGLPSGRPVPTRDAPCLALLSPVLLTQKRLAEDPSPTFFSNMLLRLDLLHSSPTCSFQTRRILPHLRLSMQSVVYCLNEEGGLQCLSIQRVVYCLDKVRGGAVFVTAEGRVLP